MKKEIKPIFKKLKKYHISFLSAIELKIYFEYRIENLLRKKIVLVKNELEYLFGETGPGNLRIDPELTNLLIKENSFMHIQYSKIPEIQEILNTKQKIEKIIKEKQNSEIVLDFFTELLKNYLQNVKLISKEPLIIAGSFNDIPLSILIKNGKWIMPNAELFSFFMSCQTNNYLPIIISKKIHGALFPVFKNLSVLGCNTYKIYLPKYTEQLINKIKSDEKILPEIIYNNQFEFITKELSQNITDGCWDDEPIKNFFENILDKYIENYYSNFSQLKYQIKDNLIDTVSQFRKNKINKKLIESYRNRLEIIQELIIK